MSTEQSEDNGFLDQVDNVLEGLLEVGFSDLVKGTLNYRLYCKV